MRQLIEKGVQAEYTFALKEVANIIDQWRQGKMDNRNAYGDMFASIKKNDKFIAMRYDGITGGRYVDAVCAIYRDKHINEEDLKELREDLREYIMRKGSMTF